MVYEVYLPTELIDPILDSVWHVPTNPNLNPSSMSGNSMFYASASKTLLFYVSALGNPMLQTLTLNLTIGHKP